MKQSLPHRPLLAILLLGVVVATTSCRTRGPAVILSPDYKRPAPYAMPQAEPASPVKAMIAAPSSRSPVVQEPAPFVQKPALTPAPPIAEPPQVVELETIQPLAPIKPAIRVEPPAPVRQTPASPPRKQSQFDASTRTWRVAKGDTLWAIGRRHNVSPAEIAAANNIQVSAMLRVGQELRIPRPGEVEVAAQPPAKQLPSAPRTPPIPEEVGDYVVSKGDSLWKIARKHGIRVADLMAWNKLNSDLLQPGQILQVAGEPVAEATPRETIAKVSHAPKAAIPTIVTKARTVATRIDEPAQSTRQSPPAAVGSTRILPHYVAAGDSLASIARLYDARQEEILARNPKITPNAPLKPGTRLEIPLPTGRY